MPIIIGLVMDTLRNLAKTDFGIYESKCIQSQNSKNKTHLITINTTPGESTYKIEPMSEYDAVKDALSHGVETACGASLKLVTIQRGATTGIGMSRKGFLMLLEAFAIDACALDLVRSYTQGFFTIRNKWSGVTCFVSNLLYSLCWSFNPGTMATRAIMVICTNESKPSEDIARDFLTILESHSAHIFTPHALAFVALVDVVWSVDKFKTKDSAVLSLIERATGHGPWGFDTWDSRRLTTHAGHGLCHLLGASRDIKNSQVRHARHLRQMDITDSLVALLEGSHASRDGSDHHLPKRFRELYNGDIQNFSEILELLRQRIANTRSDLVYMVERTRSQSSVVYALMTHEDASINTQVAQASKDLAEAAKRDSSSMKTVAVTTMAFLPAIFLATLFAVPSLRWDQPTVVQPGFWVYWAFTIPATGLVFLVWALLDGDGGVWRLVGRRRGEGTV